MHGNLRRKVASDALRLLKGGRAVILCSREGEVEQIKIRDVKDRGIVFHSLAILSPVPINGNGESFPHALRCEIGTGKTLPYSTQRRERSRDGVKRKRHELPCLKRVEPFSDRQWQEVIPTVQATMEHLVGRGSGPYLAFWGNKNECLYNRGRRFTVSLQDGWMCAAVLRTHLKLLQPYLKRKASNMVSNFDFQKKGKKKFESFRFSSDFKNEMAQLRLSSDKKYAAWVREKIFSLKDHFRTYPLCPHMVPLFRKILPEDFKLTFEEIAKKFDLIDEAEVLLCQEILKTYPKAELPRDDAFRVLIMPWHSQRADKHRRRQKESEYKKGNTDSFIHNPIRKYPVTMFIRGKYLRFDYVPRAGEGKTVLV